MTYSIILANKYSLSIRFFLKFPGLNESTSSIHPDQRAPLIWVCAVCHILQNCEENALIIKKTQFKYAAELKGLTNTIDQRNEIAERWEIWKREKATRLLETSENGISSIAVFETMNKLTPENAVMCVDVGNNAYSFGRYFEPKNQDFLMSGYLGSIGFALPAANGAWTAVGDSRPVVAVAGDGGLCQYLAEITTLVKYDMPVKLIVINNHELGKISKEQRAGEFDVWKTSLSNPNFAEFARSCGAWGKRVEKEEDLEAAMAELFAEPKAGVLEIMTDVNLI